MEVIFLNKELEKSNSIFMKLDFNILFTNIEDFIYILTIKEWYEWIKILNILTETLSSTKDIKSRLDILRKLVRNPANLLAVISVLYAYVYSNNIYKMGCLTPKELGDCYAVFIVKKEQLSQKSEEVNRKIKEIRKANQFNPISLN
jgi:hypothetical protein